MSQLIKLKHLPKIVKLVPNRNHSGIICGDLRRFNGASIREGRSVSTYEEKIKKDTTLLQKIKDKLPHFNFNKPSLMATGYNLYEEIVDRLDYVDFFEEFDLADTFYSWFVVTELHIWMLTVRVMAEGDDGKFVRNHILKALWSDVAQRVKQLGAQNPANTREQIMELSEQLQAALIAYDEGLQADDTILAAAIWRRLYQYREVDIKHLDLLVQYVRKQIRLFDHLSRDQILTHKTINWKINKT